MKLSSVFTTAAFAFGLANAIPVSNEDPVITDIIYMETNMGSFEIGLFGEVVPKTVNNFAKLAPTYQDTKTIFHRVIKNFVVQAGDFDGQGGHSFYGERGADLKYGSGFSGLLDENFDLKHDQAGRVSVANAGPNTGGSQFFICLEPQPGLDGKYVVFGQVIKGMDIVQAMGKVKTGKADKPIDDIVIEKCYSKSVRDISSEPPTDDDIVPPVAPVPVDDVHNGDKEKPSTDDEVPVTPTKPTHDDINQGGATKVAFLPLALFAVAAILMAVKNKNKVMYAIRGPRYRRVISVNGDPSST